jgi:type II secretory pathway pseudopilin PulG
MAIHAPIRRKPSEDGYMMLAVMFLLALLIISLAVAAPRIKASIQRDREVETMHRGKQYVRAIQLYYRKFGAYPPNADALVKTQEIRFLRRKYLDPMTGKDDWKPIQFGQNKTPTAMGFFGQPLAGASIGGIGPGGANGLGGANGQNPQGTDGSSGSGSQAGSSFFSNNGPGNNSGPGNSNSGIFSNSGTNGATGSTGSTDSGSSTSGTTGGLSGQTFGGAGIIGFSPASPKQSILVFKKKNHYNEWEFTYDPAMEQQMMSTGGAGLNTQPAGTSPIGTPGTIGTPNPGSSTPTPTPNPAPAPAPPTTPQQTPQQ